MLGEKPVQDDFVNEVATEPSTLQVVPEVNTVFIHGYSLACILSLGTTSLMMYHETYKVTFGA